MEMSDGLSKRAITSSAVEVFAELKLLQLLCEGHKQKNQVRCWLLRTSCVSTTLMRGVP